MTDLAKIAWLASLGPIVLCLGVASMCKRDFAGHRAWMRRGYALGVGAGTRVFSHIPWFLFPAMQGEMARTLCMSAGWTINLAVTEWLSGPAPANIRPRVVLKKVAVPSACLPLAAVVSTMLVSGWLSLLPAMLIGLPAGAAAIDNAGLDIAAKPASAAAPCYRVRCVDLATPGRAAAVKPGGAPAGGREPKRRFPAREQAEAYNCLLSAGFGGELRPHGYQGLRALGRTWTIGRAGGEAEP